MISSRSLMNKASILAIDDNPTNLTSLVRMLTGQGYKVRVAPSGKLALAMVKVHPPDLILLDVSLPEMDGYEICRKLKANQLTRPIPVIFVSATNDAMDKVQAFTAGGVDFITKPFELLEVIARIKNQLRLRELQLELMEQNALLQRQIEASRQAEVEIRLLLATTQAISHRDDVHSALEVVLRLVCLTIQWNYGEAWLPKEDGSVLECSQGWYASDPNFAEFRNHSASLTFAPGTSLQGRVWVTQESEWIEDLALEPESPESAVFLRAQLAAIAGLRSAFAVPILLNDRVLAVLVFYKKSPAPVSDRLLDLVSAVSTQLASLIQRKQTEETLRITQERYHNIVVNAVEGIYQTTPAGRYLSANLALAKIYGYDSPEQLMVSLQNIAQQLYVDPTRRQEFVQAMENDNAVMGFEAQVYRKDGSIIWISESARAVRDSKERLLYYEGTVSDITDRKQAQEQTEKLLLNILPKPITQRLREQQVIADSFSDVSVLFADLVGFTTFSSQKTPTELVEVLNLIFSKFDQLSEQHGLEKIKTIGDAYMVVGGLPMPREDHADAIAQMALDMQLALTQINVHRGENFALRIGINIGPVVAGVIGLTKFSYDLWGDTVNVASRMEASGLPNTIQVTAIVYERLKDRFEFQERGLIPVKGKGDMMAYLLVRQR